VREAKASYAATSAIAVLVAALFTLVLAPAAQASKNFVGFWGTEPGRQSQFLYEKGIGFGAGELWAPRAVAINSSGNGSGVEPGDVYVVDDGGSNATFEGRGRIDQFSEYGEFIRAFGWDVVRSGQHNTGTNPVQTLNVPSTVTGGTFKLTIFTADAAGTGESQQNRLRAIDVHRGTLQVGDLLKTPFDLGVPVGAKIAAIEGETIVLSKPLTVGAATTAFTTTETTAPINFDASASSGAGAANLQASLEALPAIGAGNVEVTGGPGASGSPFTITIDGGPLAHNQVPLVKVSNSLVGGTATATMVSEGGGLESCEAVSAPIDDCQRPEIPVAGTGTAGALDVSAIAIDQATGNIFASDPVNRRVDVLGPEGDLHGAFGWGVATGAAELEFCTTTCLAGLGGSGAGQFRDDRSLAVDPSNGHIVVANTRNARINEYAVSENGSDEVTGATFVRSYGWDVVASGPDDTGTAFEVCDVATNPTDICKAGSTGLGVGQFDDSGPSSLAVDSGGNVYAKDSGNERSRVEKFAVTGSTLVPSVVDPVHLTGDHFVNQVSSLVIGPGDHLFATKGFDKGDTLVCPNGNPSENESRIVEVDPSGNYVDTHASCSSYIAGEHGFAFERPFGINLNSGDMFLPSANGNEGGTRAGTAVYIVGQSDPPTTAIQTVAPNTTGATITGTINPNGPNPNYPNSPKTSYQIHYKRSADSTWTGFGIPVNVGGGFTAKDLTIHLGGLDANTSYDIRLVGAKAGSENGISAPETFVTLPIAPTIDAFSSSAITEGSAMLHAVINPHGSQTSYHFEYGTTSEYGSQTPEIDVGNSLQPQNLAWEITGLTPTEYHFRVVAHNALGTTRSEDQTFTYFPPSCPNATLRQQNTSAYLPDCRAYELVSPEDAGNVILLSAGWFVAPYATNPARFGFAGKWGAIAGLNPPNSDFDSYVATRTATGWKTTYPGIPGTQAAGVTFGAASPDLQTVLDFQKGTYLGGGNSLPSLAPWVWDVSGELVGRWPEQVDGIPNGDTVNGSFQPSPDFTHLAFSSSNVDFDPAGQGLISAPGSAYDYDTVTGEITLISKTPAGADIAQDPENAPEVEEIIEFPDTRGKYPATINPSVSTDGSHILMSTKSGPPCPAGGGCSRGRHLYMRVNGLVTYEIAPGHGLNYVGMTADASKVFFLSDDQLATTNSPQDTDQSTDLYMWEENGGNPALVRLSIGDAGDAGNSDSCTAGWTSRCGVRAVQDSGSDYAIATESGDVFFYSPELLDGVKGIDGAQNLYVYRDGAPQFVAALNANGQTPVSRIQFSPDGKKAAFLTKARLTPYDNQGFAEMFAYDVPSDSLRCVSCRPDGDPPTAHVVGSTMGFFMSNDGRTFFTAKDPLVPKDTNGGADVYEFVDGRPQLISAGTGETHTDPISGLTVGTELSGVSADGVNVYFLTTDVLVDNDHNGLFPKFYDARTGGGFPSEPKSAPCEAADECHGPTSVTPGPTSIISGVDLGTGGNVRKAHRKKRHKKHRRGGQRTKRHAHHGVGNTGHRGGPSR
jgi:hypothetical protein